MWPHGRYFPMFTFGYVNLFEIFDCIYIYKIYICMYTCMYVCMYVYIYMCVCVCVCVYMFVYELF